MSPPDGSGASAAERYVLRPPVAADAEELGRLHVQVWREAYTGLMRPERLASLDPAAGAERWRASIRAVGQDGTPRTVLAARRGSGALAGFATAGPARDPQPPTAAELWVVNVLAEHHGCGVADLLLAASIGEDPAYLWVVQGNGRAQAFYRRYGFAADGAHQWYDAGGVDEIRMTRRCLAGRAGGPS